MGLCWGWLMEIKYQEFEAATVVNYFAKDFEPKDGKTISDYDWFYDPKRGKFIFKLYLQEKETE